MRRLPSAVRVLVPLALAILGAGCVVTPTTPPPRGILVSGPPPAAIREERPAPPGPQTTWVAGYWHWTGLQYAWIPGHWESAPPGATWRAAEYVQNNGAYFYEPGGWSPPAGATPARPAPATPSTTATAPGAPPPSVEAFH